MGGYLYYFMMNLCSVLLLIFGILLGVSFLTLLERKSLSFIQLRKGPNKVMLIGIFQPFSDALKLFSKEFFYTYVSYKFYYSACPMIILMISLLSWVIFPMVCNLYSFNYGILFMFCCMSVGTYPLMLAGWSSNSLYSLFGALRSCAQVISYEVSLIIIFLSIIFFSESYNFMIFMDMGIMYILYMFPIFLIFFVSMLAELNRMPFDFIEGESELVSGFNTEYFGVGFSLIFMGEYCSIMFMSMIIVLVFWGLKVDTMIFIILYLMMIYLIMMVRGALPRMRYDELMNLCWKGILPFSLGYLFVVVDLKWFLLILLSG